MTATDTGAVFAISSRASLYASSSTVPVGKTRCTKPFARASAAGKTRPLIIQSSAVPMPTSRGRNQADAPSG